MGICWLDKLLWGLPFHEDTCWVNTFYVGQLVWGILALDPLFGELHFGVNFILHGVHFLSGDTF